MFLNCVFVFCLCCVFVDGAYDTPEGSPCHWQGAEGECINARRCESFSYLKDEEERPPILCSFQGKTPIICCVDCDILPHNEAHKDLLDRDYFKTGRKYEEQCLIYEQLLPYNCKPQGKTTYIRNFNKERRCFSATSTSTPPVFSAEDALKADFPHMAMLGYGQNLETAQWLCGGSLISEKHILTAAHCGSHAKLGPVKYVALGMLNRSDTPSLWKRYRVKLFYPHPQYQPPSMYHDIAILETETSVNLTEGVRPGCLTHKIEFKGDEVAFATGWGSMGPRKECDVMQKMVLQKFSAEDCSSQYPVDRNLSQGYNHTTQICYGNRNLVRDCEGYGGGPLQQRDSSARYCPYAIIGVTSSDQAFGTAGQAGLFTRVSHYVPWIESLIWSD